jgi:hypothetical protein
MALQSKRPLQVLGAAAAITLIAVTSIYLYARPNPGRADSEMYNVLSDYIASGLTGYSHDLGSRDGLVVILSRTTVTDMLLRKNWLNEYVVLVGSLAHARRNLHLTSQWPILNLLVANLRPEQLKEHFTIPAQYVVATEDEVRRSGQDPSLKQRFAHSYGYLTFTRVGFNRQLREAVFYTEHVCGMCGEGKYVHMRKLNGKWFVQAESGTWIS